MWNGDLGVDIFFVLSGFLIAYITIKENRKYGDNDISNFYRGRFLRIWPALAMFVIVYSFVRPEGFWPEWVRDQVPILMFFKNFMFDLGS